MVVITIENNEIDNVKSKQLIHYLISSQYLIQNFGITTLLTLILKTIGSFSMPAPKIIGAGNNKIIGNSTQLIDGIN